MREILFRGKMKDAGEWAYGALCCYDSDTPTGPSVKRVSIIMYDDPFDGYWVEVATETVGQYTGLTDKNGKKIFEGDIVRFSYTGKNRGVEGLAAVIFQNGKFCVEWGWHKDIVCLDGFANTTLEVIGNIHDNLELIGGTENDK